MKKEGIILFKVKDYGFPVYRFLNQWQATLFVSHGVNIIDTYVSVDNQGKYSLVYVFERDKAQDLLAKFRNHELEVGEHVIKYN